METSEIGLTRFNDEGEMLKALRCHFKAVLLEKYPQIMLQTIVERCFDRTFKNYHKDKISKSMAAKFQQDMLEEFRSFYGEWVNICDVNIKKRKFHSNFYTIIKTEHGRLYGNNPGSLHDHLFYTTHCFEQFRDRFNCFKTYPLMVLAFKRVRGANPTPADMLRFMALTSGDYCRVKNFLYVNVHCGVLVLEVLSGGILIAKTFLLPHMDYPKEGWFRTKNLILDPIDWEVDRGDTPIDKPKFSLEDAEFGHYVYIMQKRGTHLSLAI